MAWWQILLWVLLGVSVTTVVFFFLAPMIFMWMLLRFFKGIIG